MLDWYWVIGWPYFHCMDLGDLIGGLSTRGDARTAGGPSLERACAVPGTQVSEARPGAPASLAPARVGARWRHALR